MKASAFAASLVVAGMLAGCATTPERKMASVDPLALVQHYTRPEEGFDYQAFCSALHLRSNSFQMRQNEPPITAEVVTAQSAETDPWRMVVVGDGWRSEWKYLIFSHDGKSWHLVGCIDLPTQPYVQPDHTFETDCDGTVSLVLTYVSCWGTDVYHREVARYSVAGESVRLKRKVAFAE